VAGGSADALVWDWGNLEHAMRHGISQEEIEAMYESGRWIVADDPLGRPGQERVIGEIPNSFRLITVAIEWVESSEALAGWCRRPISAWEARPPERAAWQEEFGDV
jgi:uncharacterized DUF497 family protein